MSGDRERLARQRVIQKKQRQEQAGTEKDSGGGVLSVGDVRALQGMVGNTAVGVLGRGSDAVQRQGNGEALEGASSAAFDNIVQRTPSKATDKPQITSAPKGQVQRLMKTGVMTRSYNAGAAKEDKYLGPIKLKTMSGRYKKILTAVDAYHEFSAGKKIVGVKGRNAQSVKGLISRLQVVMNTCRSYLDGHKKDQSGRKKIIERLMAEAEREIQAIQKIHEQLFESLVGQAWADVLPEMVLEGRDMPEAQPLVQEMGNILNPTLKVQELLAQNAFDDTQFHGSGSLLLDKITDGKIYTGKALQDAGKGHSTGEGDFFSRPKKDDEAIGEKPFISTGQGLPGMGTALQYAQAAADDKNYNPARYTDDLLDLELAKLNRIIENWDSDLNQVPADDIMGARKTKGQFEGLRKKLIAEKELRETLPDGHARRRGETYDESSYGLLLEFASHDLDIRNPRPDITMQQDTDSPRALGGERSIWNESVNLRDPGRLLRVYCPAANRGVVKQKVSQIVQHNNFEVIPFEALINMPNAMKFTQIATAETLETQYEKMRQMVLETYAEGMGTGTAVDKDALVAGAGRMNLGNLYDDAEQQQR